MKADQGKPQLVFVHGIGGPRDPQRELVDWKRALAEGARAAGRASEVSAITTDWLADASFAHYGDLFGSGGAQGGADAAGLEEGELEIAREALVELLDDVLELPEHRADPKLHRARAQLAPGGRKGAQGVMEVARTVNAVVATVAAVPGLAGTARALSRAEVLGIISQPGRYLARGRADDTGRTFDQRVRDRLLACLDPARPAVVVAHSLGSVVALETLAHYPGPVPLFVTLGSPITTRTFVWPLLRPKPTVTPENVDAWADFRDGDDPVVPKHRLTKSVGPSSRGVRPRSERLDSKSLVPHGALRYLRRPEVADRVLRALTATAVHG
ncbi:alpha/beta fold hydrolase [Kitasatospora phosalacinea]|uniref:Uncharacterized protein n=1 Tax=Kitasatospora phosalacinea TaxID=2065 RepID=A0A9W6PBS9_9ACTN|nr:hypothetical protein [Kitasatospora phosalacinea]GLW52103.1 hypothetical protein Kpho01_01140 [Kitasatospora phosalacinea]